MPALVVTITVALVVAAAAAGRGRAQGEDAPAAAGLPSGARVSVHSETGRVRFVGAPAGGTLAEGPALSAGGGPEAAAGAFLSEYGMLFGVAGPEADLVVTETIRGTSDRQAVRYQQYYQGVPVLGGELVIQVEGGMRVLAAIGEALPEPHVDVTPRVTSEEACRRAVQAVARDRGLDADGLTCSQPALWIYNPALLGGPGPRRDRLVWRIEVRQPGTGVVRELVLVDAHMAAIALQFSMVDEALNRRIHDNANQPYLGLPGTLVRTEGAGPTGLLDADAAYQFLGDTYDLFLLWHGRDGWDDAGAAIVATTRYCEVGETCPYDNAFWNGEQLVFGQGYARADDVVAHEYTHAVTEHSSHLFYYMQSGTINEALSDIWGEFVDQSNGYDGAGGSVRWSIGEDLSGGAMRSLSDPSAYQYYLAETGWQSYADRMSHPGYYCGSTDNGGVHLNSGIAAKAAYLLSDGGTFNGLTVAPLGIPKTSALFYEVQTQLLTSGAGYADLSDALIQAAYNLVSDAVLSSTDVTQVQKAVAAVEMDEQPPACSVAEAPVCTVGTPQDVFWDDLEDADVGHWASVSLAGWYNTFYYPQNPNDVGFDATYAHSGVMNIWGYDQEYIGDFAIALTRDMALPAGAYLRFNHSYAFEAGYLLGEWLNADGGVVEYSTDGGGTWHDAGQLFTDNGYNGVLSSDWGNPLGGRSAFVSTSGGYTASRLDLSDLAGQPFRIRFRMGTDDGGNDYGWFIDDIRVYTCMGGSPATTTPTVARPSATPGTPVAPTATPTPTPTRYRLRLPAVRNG